MCSQGCSVLAGRTAAEPSAGAGAGGSSQAASGSSAERAGAQGSCHSGHGPRAAAAAHAGARNFQDMTGLKLTSCSTHHIQHPQALHGLVDAVLHAEGRCSAILFRCDASIPTSGHSFTGQLMMKFHWGMRYVC